MREMDNPGKQEEQFTQLFRQYAGRVFHFFKKEVKRDDLAEDLTQEVFARIWKKKDNIFTDTGRTDTIDAYLFVSARNLLYDYLNRILKEESYLQQSEEHDSSIASSYSHIEEDITSKELQAQFDSILNSLPPQRKKAFELSRDHHLSYQEIAGNMGIAPRTVEKHISAALKTLRSRIASLTTILTLFIIW
jgi:RNA polymerase sigma-19 factor, ECF subfamily